MPRAGEWVGRYELARVLGQGGMGQVWLARGQEIAGTRRSVALKLFPFDDSGDDLDNFMGEARIAMLLSHSNVVQVFDAGESESGRFLVMELVDGVDLGKIMRAQWRAKQSLELETAMFIVAQVLRALHYAHGLRQDGQPLHIVHRDVSPQNVLVSVSGEVKLADFGIARSAIHSTAGTHVKGKLRYMAPEQLDGGVLTQAADLYAVGAILHELVSDAPFRRGQGVAELCREISAAEIPTLARVVPPELEDVRRRLLAADPRERFASAAEALRTLQSWPAFRDCTFAVAELCEQHVAPEPVVAAMKVPRTEVAETRRGDTGREPPMAGVDADAIARMTDADAPRRWPIAAVAGVVVVAAVGVGWWRPWIDRAPVVEASQAVVAAGPGEANNAAAPVAKAEPPPLVVDPPPPPEDEPAEVAAPEVDEDPRPQGRRRRGGGKAKTVAATPGPRSDGDVLASVRASTRRACADVEGAARIEIDFLIEADGRPALLRSSSPGDPRSACVEKKLRGARFAAGSSRRASLGVSFDS